MMNSKAFRTTAMLLFGGLLISFIAPRGLGQFAAMFLLVAGLVGLFDVLDEESRKPGWSGRLGKASAVVALALFGVLLAAEGAALEPLGRALRSYHSVMLGLAFGLGAVAIDGTPGVPRALGALMALSGAVHVIAGVGVGIPQLVGPVTVALWTGWLLVLAWRHPAQGTTRPV